MRRHSKCKTAHSGDRMPGAALMWRLHGAEKEWEDLRDRGDYEDDCFFVSQLFEENWQPRSTI